VIVVLENPTNVDVALAEALAPFDENKNVAPYREYETGEPAEHWIYTSLERHANEYATGTGIKPYDPSAAMFSSTVSRHTVEAQRTELKRLSMIYHSLSNPPTWESIAYASSVWFGKENDLRYDDEEKRAYTVSTYNPNSKWDWYQVGGRWTGYFKVKRGADWSKLINGTPGLMTAANSDVSRCDAGVKAGLDLDAMRDEKGAEASAAYDRYHALVAGCPEAKPWKYFRSCVDVDPAYTTDQARDDYAKQRRVRLVMNTEFDAIFGPDPIEVYAKPRELIVERARARAVPGYAVLTHDGEWMAPGKMGWFGMSSDDDDSYEKYLEAANAYLNALPDDVWLVQVDCHI